MKRVLRTSLVAALVVGAVGAPAATAKAAEPWRFGCDYADASSVNLYSSDRESFPADTIVVTRVDDYADALAATPLARALNAPILVTYGSSMTDWMHKAVADRNVKNAVVVGGPQAVSEGIVTDLERRGVSVRRIAGTGRTDTAVRVGQEVERLTGQAPKSVYLATGLDFPDALTAGAAAAHADGVVLLSLGETLDDTTRAALRTWNSGRLLAVGGAAAKAARGDGLSATNLVGADRFETGRKVAEHTFDRPSEAVVVSGTTFGHALPASAWAAAKSAPLVLTAPDRLSQTTGDYLARARATPTIFGGRGIVSDRVLEDLRRGNVPTIDVVPKPDVAPKPAPTDATHGRDVAAWEQEILARTNAERAAQGQPALTWNPCLGDLARTWSKTMARPGAPFEHSSREFRSTCGLPMTGENIAAGYGSPTDVMAGWMRSPGHRANILRPYTTMGVGVAFSADGRPYYTQIFAGTP